MGFHLCYLLSVVGLWLPRLAKNSSRFRGWMGFTRFWLASPIFRIRSAAKLRNDLLKGLLPGSSNCFAARDHCAL